MKILIIEGDENCAESVALSLKAQGLAPQVAFDAEAGVDFASSYEFDLIVLAAELRPGSGFDVLRKLRSRRITTPIIMLSGVDGREDLVRAFGLGADDFLEKPFHTEELIARIKAIVRRSRGHAHSQVVIGDLVVDLDGRQVIAGAARVHLTGKEYQIVEALALRAGKVVSKEMLLDHLYGGRDEPEAKIVDVFICKLRRKLGGAYIDTVWGRGYMLREPGVSISAEAA